MLNIVAEVFLAVEENNMGNNSRKKTAKISGKIKKTSASRVHYFNS